MRLTCMNVLLYILLLVRAAQGQPVTIETNSTVQPSKFIEQIQRTPIDSMLHMQLLRYAYYTKHSRAAYEAYTAMCKRNPDDAYANLWRGISIMAIVRQNILDNKPTVLEEPSKAGSREKGNAKPPAANINQIPIQDSPLTVARQCFVRAIKADPKSTFIELQVGYFYWQWDLRLDEGIKMMRRAVAADPGEVEGHLKLAEVYMNASGRAYDLKASQREVSTAIRIEPYSPTAHLQQVTLWITQGDYRKADSEMQRYLSVAPSYMKQSLGVKILQNAISQELAGK